MFKRERDDTDLDKEPGFHSPTELVTFIVGKEGEEKSFKVHKEFVCYHSEVLRAAFNNDRFVEGKTQTYRLDDVTSSCFRLFVQWVYQHDFDVFVTKEAARHLQAGKGKDDLCRRVVAQDLDLAQLWVLGDKFMIPVLQNKVMDKLVIARSEVWVYTSSWFPYVYENTSESSLLRKFAVVFAASFSGDFKKHRECYPTEMLFDILEKARYTAWNDIARPVAADFYVETPGSDSKASKSEQATT